MVYKGDYYGYKMNKKIISYEEIESLSKKIKEEGKKIVTTNGAFDILHVGHIRAFYEAKAQGDVLIVGLNSDRSIKEYKGPSRPINSQDDRAEMLAALEMIDYIVIFDNRWPMEFLEKVKPDVHCKGGQYSKETMPEWEVIERNGGKVHLLQMHEGFSTTKVIEKSKEG